jgi:FAD/FMN-containing dehydrogenase
MTDFTELAIAGRVATAADPDWDAVRMGWNLATDQRPAAVALVESADDVAATVAFAAANGLKVAGQGTGHGSAGLPPLDDTVLIKTGALRGIEIDAEARTARVEAGVLSLELGEAGQPHDLCGMPGSSPDVGVVGYTLGGGLSWIGREHGFACNRVNAIELVTAEGERRTVDANDGADLFWALRGGGGGYAIVTALHLDLLEIPAVYSGALVFPAEVGIDAVRTYRDWAGEQPDEVTSVVRFITPPPLPDVPEPIRGRPLLTIDGACLVASKEEGEAIIAPLRAGIGSTIMDTYDWIPAVGMSRIHMDPESPVPGVGEGGLVTKLDDAAIEAFVALAGPDSGSPLLLTELRRLGGAFARPAEGSGALSHIDADYVMYSVGIAMSPDMGEAAATHLKKIEETMRPWAPGGAYFNFTEAPCDVDAILPPEVCDRLKQVKRDWDPEGRVVANHAVSLGEV